MKKFHGSVVDEAFNVSNLSGGNPIQIGVLGKIESHESISVFIGSSLPRRVCLCKEEFHTNGSGNGLVSDSFSSVIIRHRSFGFNGQRAEPPNPTTRLFFCGKIAWLGDDHLSRLPFNRRSQYLSMSVVDNVVAFPMTEFRPCFNDFRAFFNVDAIWDADAIPSLSS